MEETQALTKKERRELKKQRKLMERKRKEQKEQLKKWLNYALIGAVVMFLGWYSYSRIVPVAESENDKPIDRTTSSDWIKGERGAKVQIIEYSDFQCPACKAFRDIVDELIDEYGDQVVIAYRHNPLKQIHAQANLAAQAAEAAGKQGKFWEMHDMLFDNQTEWSENRNAKSVLVKYAEELNLDTVKFKQDIESKEIKGLVKADYTSAVERQLFSTPSFFINGEKIKNPNGVEAFKLLIDQVLSATASAETIEQQ